MTLTWTTACKQYESGMILSKIVKFE